MTDLMDELRAALLAEHDANHATSFAEGCGCETCQLILRVWEHDHSEEQHITEFRLDGWSIQHPRACRPNLLDCEVHRLVREEIDSWEDGVVPMAPGRYVTTTDDGGLGFVPFDVPSDDTNTTEANETGGTA